jgi:arginyl-tRNA synthetase
VKRHLESLLRAAVERAVAAGDLALTEVPPFTVEAPTEAAFGDLATNLAMVSARAARRPPRAVAEIVQRHIEDPNRWLASIDIAGPGFMNFRFAPGFWQMLLRQALEAGDQFGRSTMGQGQRVQVEFVSANPTGPLHIGHGRGAVIGDVAARLLEATGFAVEREYYVNDYGRQMDTLGRSTWARYRQVCGEAVSIPEDGYPGEYLLDVAKALQAESADDLRGLPEAEAIERCQAFAGRVLLDEIRADLARFGVRFDRFVSERALHTSGAFERAVAALPPDALYEDDEAVFFRTTAYGDEKDRAVRRRTGAPTYFGGDIAHFHQTLAAGFTRLVNVLGADHHGYVARLRAIIAAFGGDPQSLQVLLVQLVNLTRGGEPVRMGKRAGEFVTLREVLDEVGGDAARFFFLLRRSDSQLDFDLELAKQQSSDNPVFYAQYAHARIASIRRQAEEAGIVVGAAPDLSPLGDAEAELVRSVAGWPDVVEAAARELEPHRIVFYVLELAAAFHRYYNRQRILTDDATVTRARVALICSVQQVLRSALDLAGVAAPERM